MKIGFIGLGKMGSGIAANLLKAGHEVTVFNRTPGKDESLVKQGAQRAAQIADACRGEAVLTMLADDPAVESVVFGAGGIADSMGKGAIHVSLSTISVALSQKLTTAHAERTGQLFIAAAGADDAIDACLPLFEAFGQRTYRFGNHPPDANLVKLSGNFLITSVIESLAEAMALVGKAGLDQHHYLDFLTSSLFAIPIYKNYGAMIADKKFVPAGFSAPLGFKDNRLVLAAAENLRVPMPLATLIYNRFLTLLAQGGESLDWSAISLLAAEDAGLEKKAA